MKSANPRIAVRTFVFRQYDRLCEAVYFGSRQFKVFGTLLLFSVTVLCFSAEAFAQGGGPIGSFSEAGFEDDLIRNAVGNLFQLIEGAFGALVMVVAGLAAIIAAAMGSYRMALSMLIVAVGAFTLRALVSLFFGTEYPAFEGF